MKTRVTNLLGIRCPVIQGGMAWVADYHLAAAVSEAGGLGMIGAGGASGEWVRAQIREVKKRTDRPFGVNLMLMNPEADLIAKILEEERVPVVTTGAGNPEKYMAMWKEAGVKVIPLESRGDQSDPGDRIGGNGKTYGTGWRRCRRRGGHGSRGAYRREYDDGSCPADRGCSDDPGDRCRRYCRRTYYGGGIDARSRGSTDGNCVYRNERGGSP